MNLGGIEVVRTFLAEELPFPTLVTTTYPARIYVCHVGLRDPHNQALLCFFFCFFFFGTVCSDEKIAINVASEMWTDCLTAFLSLQTNV